MLAALSSELYSAGSFWYSLWAFRSSCRGWISGSFHRDGGTNLFQLALGLLERLLGLSLELLGLALDDGRDLAALLLGLGRLLLQLAGGAGTELLRLALGRVHPLGVVGRRVLKLVAGDYVDLAGVRAAIAIGKARRTLWLSTCDASSASSTL
jgi:hypothetical protein